MKFIFALVLALSFNSFAGDKSTTYKSDSVNYGTRSDGKVVPTSKTTRTKTVREEPQYEEHMEDSDADVTRTQTTKEVRTKKMKR